MRKKIADTRATIELQQYFDGAATAQQQQQLKMRASAKHASSGINKLKAPPFRIEERGKDSKSLEASANKS
jgi:hypothetical protein